MTLFPEPPRVPHSLSEGYSGREFRARRGRTARWSAYRSVTGRWCDECFMIQHEHRNEPLVRARQYATRRRSLAGGPALLLCGPHASLWRERDQEDTA